jgi:general secretion pathway protein F
MIRYRYQAYTAGGQLVVDMVSAESEGEAVRQLMAEGLTPFEIAPASLAADATRKGAAPRQSGRVLSSFFRNLSAMQAGGLPLDEALKLLSEDGESRAGQRLAGDLRRSVLAGESLGQAMASLKLTVPDYVLGLVRAGEEGGDLVQVLQRVANTLENQSRLADAVRSALIYPVILLSTSLASILLILLVVAPALEPVLTAAGDQTPAAAAALIGASRFLTDQWPELALGTLLLLLGIMIWQRTNGAQRALNRLMLRIPLVGELVRDMESARMLASVSALLENGMSLVPALEVAAEGAGNRLMQENVKAVAGAVRTGESLSAAIGQGGIFPPIAAQLAAVGERSGDMPRQLGHASNLLEQRSQKKIQTLMAIAGPTLTLFLGLLIGGVVLTLLSAILSVNDLALVT